MSVSQFLAPGRFPAGTVLGVYKTNDPSRQPSVAAVATPTMTATGVTVSGLEATTSYVAGAVVGGRWLGSAFRTTEQQLATLVVSTQAAYDALTPKDANTLYVIVG